MQINDLWGASPKKFREDYSPINEEFNIGDTIEVTGPVLGRGSTGIIKDVGKNGHFVVVDLGHSGGIRSYQASDVSLVVDDFDEWDELDEHGGGIGPKQHWQTLVKETDVDLDEHGGGIGPKQHWQKLVRETDTIQQMDNDELHDELYDDEVDERAGPVSVVDWQPHWHRTKESAEAGHGVDWQLDESTQQLSERAGPVDTVRWAQPWINAGRNGASLAKDIDYNYTQDNTDNQSEKPDWSSLETFYDYNDVGRFDNYDIKDPEDAQGIQHGSADCDLVNYELFKFDGYDIEIPGLESAPDNAPEEDTDPEMFDDAEEEFEKNPYDLGYPTPDAAIKLTFPTMTNRDSGSNESDDEEKTESTTKTSEKVVEAVTRIQPNIVLGYTDREIYDACYRVSDNCYGKRLSSSDYGILARQVLKILKS